MTHKPETQENVSGMNFNIASHYQHDVTENANPCLEDTIKETPGLPTLYQGSFLRH